MSNSNGDEYIFEEAVAYDKEDSPFSEKQMMFINDTNNSVYNGSIYFDTSPLTQSGNYLSYSEAYLEIPFVITMTNPSSSAGLGLNQSQWFDPAAAAGAGAYAGAAAAFDATSPYLLGLKNGYHQIVNSLEVYYQDKNVVRSVPFTNFYCSYKIMSSWSQDDLAKWGQTVGLVPDTAGSQSFSAGASANGNGTLYNNVAYLQAARSWAATAPLNFTNDGFLQRLNSSGYNATAGYGNNVELNTVALCNNIGKNTFQNNGVNTAGRIYQWNILCTIRLKDLSDFFDKLPIVKGAIIQMQVNYNSCSETLNIGSGVQVAPLVALNAIDLTTITLSQSSLSMQSGQTNPLMSTGCRAVAASTLTTATGPVFAPLNGAGVGSPWSYVVATALQNNILSTAAPYRDNSLSINCGVSPTLAGSSVANVFADAQISACRLYVPTYKLNALNELNVLRSQPRSVVFYEDLYHYNISNVSAGASFTRVVSQGIVRPKALVMIPMLNNAAGNAATASLTPYRSLFDAAPGTTAPLAAVTQFNVTLNGQDLFNQNEQYDFEQFSQELAKLNGLCLRGDNDSVGVCSGLLGKFEWDNSYRYYVCDLNRLTYGSTNPCQIQVKGINNTSKIMDYHVFIVMEKSISINTETGDLL